ncbi:MAG: YihY/virulence factor BrkB family protein [Bacilli bacterium]|nr:YihY/virulence factor BrkB family protein [Bacilli bacterium]
MKKRIKEFYDLISGKEMGILPGNLAFSFFMAIIPILTLIFYLLTSFNLPMNIITQFLESTFPSGVVDLLQPIFADEMSVDSLITIIFGFIVAANGCGAIIIASNTIYNFENAPLLRRGVKSVFLTFIMILLFAFVLIVPLFGTSIIGLLSSVFPFISQNEFIVDIIYFILRVPVSFFVILFLIKLLYTLSPDDRIPSKYTTKGAVFTTISWIIATYVYSFYINNIADYNLVYGNLANIVILLFWFYVLAYVFVLGLFMNKRNNEIGIEKTNSIKLDEIRKRVEQEKKKK